MPIVEQTINRLNEAQLQKAQSKLKAQEPVQINLYDVDGKRGAIRNLYRERIKLKPTDTKLQVQIEKKEEREAVFLLHALEVVQLLLRTLPQFSLGALEYVAADEWRGQPMNQELESVVRLSMAITPSQEHHLQFHQQDKPDLGIVAPWYLQALAALEEIPFPIQTILVAGGEAKPKKGNTHLYVNGALKDGVVANPDNVNSLKPLVPARIRFRGATA